MKKLVKFGTLILIIVGFITVLTLFSNILMKIFAPDSSTETNLSQTELSGTAIAAGDYEAVDPGSLVAYPDDYIGKLISVSGTVFNINNHTEFQMYVGDSYDPVYIITSDSVTLSKDQVVKVYGTDEGQNCGTNALGAKICQPLIQDAVVK
jgi:hypothetical protein